MSVESEPGGSLGGGSGAGPAGHGAPMVPHPVIEAYYADSLARRAYLTEIFDATASDYDRVERWLSFGTGRWYRRKALQRAGLKAGDRVLDVAVGTGLVAREALRIVREGGGAAPGGSSLSAGGSVGGSVVGIDPSAEMLRRAVEALGIEGRVGRAERLEFADASFDFVSMGYALRHMDDLVRVFAEQRRVLKPGGRVCVLEITRPEGRVGRAMLKGYLRFLSRTVGRVAGLKPRTGELWEYYYETIDLCVPPERVMEAMRAAGFVDVKRHRELGLFSEFTGQKPVS